MPAEGTLRDRGAAGFHLIETMRWSPPEGLVRGDLHVERLRRSAGELRFALDEARLRELLDSLSEVGDQRRVRLTLHEGGEMSLQHAPFLPLASDAVWRVAIAKTTLDQSNELLRHKTSHRAPYEAARAEFPADDVDEVILLNEEGDVCEGTITSVFVRGDGDTLETPALESGLLAGVLRAELIASGKALERRLTPDDLRSAPALFVGNSLRGLIPARLVSAG